MATRKSKRSSSATSASMAIHQIAKAVDLSSRELRETIDSWELGWDTSSHMKKLDADQIREVERRLKKSVLGESDASAQPASDDKPAKPRRTRKKKTDTDATDAPAAKAEQKAPAAKKSEPASDDKPAKPRRTRKKKTDTDATDAPAAKAEQKAPAAKSEPASDDKPAKPRRTRKKKSDADATDAPAAKAEPEAPEAPRDLVAEGRDWLRQTLQNMGFTHPRVEGRDDGNRLEFNIRGADAEELIGQRNASARTDMIDALQSLLHRALFGSARGSIVVIDVLNFRQERVDELADAAQSAAEFVRKSGKTMRFAAMNAFDRRAMHVALGDEKGVRAESVGQGLHRRLEVSPAGGRANKQSADNNDAPKNDDSRSDDNRRGRGRRSKRDGDDGNNDE